MKTALILLVPYLLSTFGQGRQIQIDGLVYDGSKIAGHQAGAIPKPEDLGVAGVEVSFEPHVPGVQHPMVTLATTTSDEQGRVRTTVELSDRFPGMDKMHLKGIAKYKGGSYPFEVAQDGTFRVAVYESTNDPAAVRVTRHRMVVSADPSKPGVVSVLEMIHIVNEGRQAFQGILPQKAMKTGLLATIRATGGPRSLRASLAESGTPLPVVTLDSDIGAVMGAISPTGPVGEDMVIQYILHLGEKQKGSITRRLIVDTDRFEMYTSRSGLGPKLSEGFSEAEDAPGDVAPGYLVRSRDGVAAGEEIRIDVNLASGKMFIVALVFGAVFLVAVLLAVWGAVKGAPAVEPGAAAEPLARRIARLDIRNARGEIDPADYARERDVLLREAMASRAIEKERTPTVGPEVLRLLEKIDAVEESNGEESVKEGKRQAYLEEILEALRRQSRALSQGGGPSDG